MLVDLSFDNGIIGYMILATLLAAMLIPGFAFFYGGLSGKKNYGAIMMQSFVSLGISVVLWFICGYSLCFNGDSLGGFIGGFHRIFMLGVGMNFAFYANHRMPESVFIFYQMIFSVIAPVIISAAFYKRFNIIAFAFFIILWQFLVNYPLTHLIWAGGLFQKWGFLDFSGGLIIQVAAGFTALAGMIFAKQRNEKESAPNSIPFMSLGAAMVWLGWFGLCSGRVLGVTNVTGFVILNTAYASGFSAFTWFILEWSVLKKSTIAGIFKGALAGLIAISAAAGFVALQYAVVIGVAAGFVCFVAVFMKRKFGWDDAFNIWALHGVGGLTGIILTGIFAEKVLNENGIDGLLQGNSSFFIKQCVGGLTFALYAFVVSYVLLFLLSKFSKIASDETDEEQQMSSIQSTENPESD